ncbi:MAG TPA: TCR/Tet family MFS transporter [Steroidobacteraceae bacterium]|nr:TCR/Tet family MFS transporter [Steroidobacteraceae bacterium]
MAERRAAIAFIFITILLDMLALGMIIPVLPKLIESFMGGDTASAAKIYGIFGTVWAFMQFVSMPVMGALSDRFGRRPVILLSNLGLGLDYILMALAPSLRWLFVGRLISGVTAASISTAMAYVADVTPAERRAAGFGMMGVAFGAGFVLGPAIGGILGSIDPRLPFWAAAVASLANAAYGFLILPESLPPERRRAFEWRRANPVGSLQMLRSHPQLKGLAGVSFLSSLAHAVLPSTMVLYAGYRYGWDERTVGLSLAVIGVCSAIVQGALIGPAVRRFGERRTLLVGLGAGAVGFLIYALARTGAIFMIGVPVVALWGLAGPSVQGLMTRYVDPTQQGQLQGANGSVLGVATMIGPGLFAGTFAYFIGPAAPLHLPGAAFMLASVLLITAALLAGSMVRAQPAAPFSGADMGTERKR